MVIQTNHDWERIARHVVQPQQIVLVIGSVDVGKSTFCRFLVEQGMSRGLKVGFVDADVGQSQIGPPTTIGLKFFGPNELEVEQSGNVGRVRQNGILEADDFYFVGWISPERHMLQCLTGTRLMVDAALETGVDFLVIDTTGYIDGMPALVLKQQKIELIKPNHLICIHRSRELDAIVSCFDNLDCLHLHRLSPHKAVTSKSNEFRRKYRESGFDCYFSNSVVETLPFDQIRGQRTPFFIGRQANAKELDFISNLIQDRALYAEWGHRSLTLVALDVLPSSAKARLKSHLSLINLFTETPAHFEGRLIGLLNANGKALSIGIIEGVDFQASQLQIRCRAGVARDARIIQFGHYQANWKNERQ